MNYKQRKRFLGIGLISAGILVAVGTLFLLGFLGVFAALGYAAVVLSVAAGILVESVGVYLYIRNLPSAQARIHFGYPLFFGRNPKQEYLLAQLKTINVFKNDPDLASIRKEIAYLLVLDLEDRKDARYLNYAGSTLHEILSLLAPIITTDVTGTKIDVIFSKICRRIRGAELVGEAARPPGVGTREIPDTLSHRVPAPYDPKAPALPRPLGRR